MPRINIEDKLMADERMKYVIRKMGEEMAVGSWYRIARCAQRYWLDDKQIIPTNVWDISDFENEFLISGLVEKRENGYYLRGSEEYFAWLVSKRENGRRGGIRSGETRKNNELIEANRSEAEANASETNPLPLPLPPALIHNTILSVSTDPTKHEVFEDGYDNRNATPQQVISIWNQIAKETGMAQTRNKGTENDLTRSIKTALKTFPHVEHWQRIITSTPNAHRSGLNETGWRANLAWLFQNKKGTSVKNYNLIYDKYLEQEEKRSK